jgi:cytochrome bd-type quinol oxidase subunit 2
MLVLAAGSPALAEKALKALIKDAKAVQLQGVVYDNDICSGNCRSSLDTKPLSATVGALHWGDGKNNRRVEVMSNRTTNALTFVLILACIGAGVWAYPLLPEKVASHWDEHGNVNGYMSKFWGVFLVPLMLIGLAALFWAIPKIDPLRANIETFRREYNLLVLFVLVFLAFVFGFLSQKCNCG